MDPKHDKRVETIPLSHLPRSVLVYDLKEAQKHIADLEARDKLKAEEYDTRIVLAAQFERERDEARAKAVRAEGALASIVTCVDAMPPGTWTPPVVTIINIAEDVLKGGA